MKQLTKTQKLPAEVAAQLGPYYVYMLIDPLGNVPFYIGKGKGNRLLSHEKEADKLLRARKKTEKEKIKRIREIRARAKNKSPLVHVLRHGITSSSEALRIEASVIQAMEGITKLTNIVKAFDEPKGRASLPELVTRYKAPKLKTSIPALLIIQGKWNKKSEYLGGHLRKGYGWREEMTDTELYDSIRGWWRLNQSRIKQCKIKYAVSIRNGITREIYEISKWSNRRTVDGRIFFTGKPIKSGQIWEAFIGKSRKRVPIKLGHRNAPRYWPLLKAAR